MQTGRRLEGCCLPRDLPLTDMGGCLSIDITVLRDKTRSTRQVSLQSDVWQLLLLIFLIVLYVFI